MKKTLLLFFLSLVPILANCASRNDTVALALMDKMSVAVRRSDVGMLEAQLYVRQRVEVEKKNLIVSLFPDMTVFDKGVKSYLSEYLYDVISVHGSLPKIRRTASLSSFGHGNGEMDRVMSYMSPHVYGERLFAGEYLSPLEQSNRAYYRFSLDTAFLETGKQRILFVSRFDNIQLFSSGAVVIDETDSLPVMITLEGWDEQSHFAVDLFMGKNKQERFVVDSIALKIGYAFLGNRMEIDVAGDFSYKEFRALDDDDKPSKNLVARSDLPERLPNVDDVPGRLSAARITPLTKNDSLLYISNRAFGGVDISVDTVGGVKERIGKFLWRVGDRAISSHTLAWGDSDLKFSPLINPSYLSYTTSKGFSYKLALNFRTRISRKCALQIKPMIGYNFKYKEFYWGIRSALSFAPMKRGVIAVDVERGTTLYSSAFHDAIKNTPIDSLDFGKMPILFYREGHIRLTAGFEPVNGFELQAGATYYRHSLYGDAVGVQVAGDEVKEYYCQFAPHLRVTWHPGMYYYVADGRKVNVGSLAPRFAFDVEQGISGVMGSHGVYTRAELDMQYKRRITSSGSLYLRAGGGGYFHTKDIYFVKYAFLKDNPLPLDRDDEASGVFQLLGREWYNSASNYARINASYSSPFMLLQRIVPRASFIKNESMYAGLLFISHLCPYWECGYGVETPYIDAGLFIGFENENFSRVGCKVSFSLFKE